MPRKLLDGLRVSLRTVLAQCSGELRCSAMALLVLVLQMLEEAEDWLGRWIASQELPPDVQASEGSTTASGDPAVGLDPRSLQDSAKHLLGQSIADICDDLPDYLRILHVEPVFRNNLVGGFLARQKEIHQDVLALQTNELRRLFSSQEVKSRRLADDKEGLADTLAQPRVTFHGAPRHVISSIVRYGFVLPGDRIGKTNQSLHARHPSTFGAGIYSSPDPEYASRYMDFGYGRQRSLRACVPSQVPGMRLLVCATLMGRPLHVTQDEAWRTSEVLHHAAHSHVSSNKMEYIVFDARQIIPCYVLHVDYGSDRAKAELANMPTDPREVPQRLPQRRRAKDPRKQSGYVEEDGDDEESSPGVVKAKKQALKAAATKWFPYGYGTARGTSFVIDEIAEVSDDEEDYGDFQEMRNAREEMREEAREEAHWQGGSWFDEYQTVRKTKREVELG
ncbi:hypothetical protein B0A55_03197 [Friedmanniomyces simplex]|uniref:PARP catalytic domain-containing protein n=1 Tax=Friedmanniomyces simplex TaxID=329884 RepID=A0A4U0XPQ8_9PEZI|nr:hypothetical protein B0A55_03197 [Friedmanniomyces simplex]